jgi:hypothetical protein
MSMTFCASSVEKSFAIAASRVIRAAPASLAQAAR